MAARKRPKYQSWNIPELKTIERKFDHIISRGYDPSRVFEDWLDLMIYAFMRDDEKYLQIVKKYPNNHKEGLREIDLFCDMLASLIIAMNTYPLTDILGEFFEAKISFGNNGQFFTPQNICDMMAKMNQSGQNPLVNDPTCGAGRMPLAYAKINRNALFVNEDIDYRCVKMCTINMFLYGLESINIWQNTITMEKWGGFKTSFKSGLPTLTLLTKEDLNKKETLLEVIT